MSSPIDLDRLAAAMSEAAKAEIMPRFRNLDPSDIREKTSATDLVTEADESAERFIRREVEAMAKDALFVGEESAAADKRLLGRLEKADLAVVVDPIDGTANFVGGIPIFAVMGAVVSKGETVGGIIHDPVSGDTMVAEKGAGAEWRLADGASRRLKVSWPVPLDEAVGNISATYFEPKDKEALLPRLSEIKIFANYRCAGHEYKMLASGAVQFCIYSRLMPWDHLAGTLICQEAGGYVARIDGSDYTAATHDGTLIAACSAQTYKTLKSRLFA